MIRTHHLLCAIILCSGLLLSSCRVPFFSRFSEPPKHEVLSFHTTLEAVALRRVAVFPLHRADGVGRSAQTMDENLTTALRELSLHEVMSVSINQRDLLLPNDVIKSNRISTDQLLKIRDTLRVDGIMIGRVEHYNSFDPMAIGLTVDLISCLDGSVAWSATGHFDSSRQDIQYDIERWYERQISHDGITGWRSTLQSPKLFTRYVAERLVTSIPVPVAKK
jgi:hypothetical protein